MESCMKSRVDHGVEGFEVGVFSGNYVTTEWEEKRIATHAISWNEEDIELPRPESVPFRFLQPDAQPVISLKI